MRKTTSHFLPPFDYNDRSFENDSINDYDDEDDDDAAADVDRKSEKRERRRKDADDEFTSFIEDVKSIDMCNLFETTTTSSSQKAFNFGDYVCRLLTLLNVDRYGDESLKNIVNLTIPPRRKRLDATSTATTVDDDNRFVERLIRFTKAIIDEPRLDSIAAEMVLLFNLLHSPRATIRRDEGNLSDAPVLIGKAENRFPSRLRYAVSLDVLDLYETSCKPDALYKRLRHPAYQEKSKTTTTAGKFATRSFLDSLKAVKSSVRRVDFSKYEKNRRLDAKTCRRKIAEDIATVQSYPELQRSLLKNATSKACKLSLSIERYVATRTGGSMDNENHRFPCFLRFVTV